MAGKEEGNDVGEGTCVRQKDALPRFIRMQVAMGMITGRKRPSVTRRLAGYADFTTGLSDGHTLMAHRSEAGVWGRRRDEDREGRPVWSRIFASQPLAVVKSKDT